MAIISRCIWVALLKKKQKDKLKYACCASGCRFRSVKRYKMVSHINGHRSLKENDSIKCPFSKCSLLFSSEEDYNDHLSYHREELNLQERGLLFLINRKEYAEGKLRCPLEELKMMQTGIPHPTLYNRKHICCWKDCNMNIPKLDDFYAHVADHVKACKEKNNKAPRIPKICQWENCGKEFKQCSVLLEHVNTHTGSKLMSCICCTQTFSNRKGLLFHMMRHARGDECRYECDKCLKKFKSEYLLKVHKKCHEYKVVCDICGRPAVSKSNLKKHMLHMHKSQCDFKCSKCDKRFKTVQGMRAHEFSHTNNVMHPCTICGIGFMTLSSYTVHRRTVHKLRPYRCHLCLDNFDRRDKLSKHLKTEHNMSPPSYTNRFKYLPKPDGVYELADAQREYTERVNSQNLTLTDNNIPVVSIDPILMQLPNSSEEDNGGGGGDDDVDFGVWWGEENNSEGDYCSDEDLKKKFFSHYLCKCCSNKGFVDADKKYVAKNENFIGE
ncbi:Histone H4 transcription factor, partial [Trichinella sp. T8]